MPVRMGPVPEVIAVPELSGPPSGPLNAAGIMQIIRDLGFLQIDTVRNVVRA